jgi:NADH:ubiquinone oxidoreductase subunit 3 (subunit A)
MNILSQWTPVGLFFIIAFILPAAPILVSAIFGPKKPNDIKLQTYECGVETVGDTWVQFNVQYYIYGIIFLVFDVEMILLLPWALAFNELSVFAFGAGFLFIFLLTDGLLYAWRKNALEWS